MARRLEKTILSDLFCVGILVRLRVHFVLYISRTFQYTYRTNCGLNKLKKHKNMVHKTNSFFPNGAPYTLFKWRKENYQGVFSDNVAGTLNNRFQSYSAGAFFRASEDWGGRQLCSLVLNTNNFAHTVIRQ